MNIYVGQLPCSFSEKEMLEMFQQYGDVASLKLIIDKHSCRSKGFGFVQMPNNAKAAQAIKELDRSLVKGFEIRVNQVETRHSEKNFPE